MSSAAESEESHVDRTGAFAKNRVGAQRELEL
jgi:hypothetical protein